MHEKAHDDAGDEADIGIADSSRADGQRRARTNGNGDDISDSITRRRALRLGMAGAVAAGAIALAGSRPEAARADDGNALVLGATNTAQSGTTLRIDNADPNTSIQVDGLRVEMARGFTALYGIAGSGVYGAVRARNTDSGPGLEAESADGPAILAVTDALDSAAIVARGTTTAPVISGLNSGSGAGVHGRGEQGPGVVGGSNTGPGVLGTGNASFPGVLAESGGGGPALRVEGSSTFNGAVTFNQPAEFHGGVKLGGMAGIGAIPRGKVSVTVANPAITATSVILLTMAGNPATAGRVILSSALWYEPRPGQGFVVRVLLPSQSDLEFAYFIAQL